MVLVLGFLVEASASTLSPQKSLGVCKMEVLKRETLKVEKKNKKNTKRTDKTDYWYTY